MENKPDALKLDLDVVMKEHGYPPILWNVPRHPQYIADEFLNGYTKHNVKQKCYHSRTLNQLREDILGGMYGDKDSNNRIHEPITPELCQKWLQHCEREIEKDAMSLGLGTKLVDIWEPNCGISVLEEDHYCPFKEEWLDEMKLKFQVMGI